MPIKNWDLGIEIQMRGMCYKMMEGLYARDSTGDSGESIFQFGGDDTAGIRAGTDALNFADYFNNYCINLHPN